MNIGDTVFIIPSSRHTVDPINTELNKLINRGEWPMTGHITGSYRSDISYHGSPCIQEFICAMGDNGVPYTTEYGHYNEATILTRPQLIDRLKDRIKKNSSRIKELEKENKRVDSLLKSIIQV